MDVAHIRVALNAAFLDASAFCRGILLLMALGTGFPAVELHKLGVIHITPNASSTASR